MSTLSIVLIFCATICALAFVLNRAFVKKPSRQNRDGRDYSDGFSGQLPSRNKDDDHDSDGGGDGGGGD